MKPILIIAVVCSLAATCASKTNEVLRVPVTILPATAVDEMGYPTNAAVALAKGAADARRDWSNGVFTIKTAGLPSVDRGCYEARLKERCGVTLEPLAGCIVSEGLDSYIQGYNKFAGEQMKRKFGTNIFSELEALAEADFKKSLNRYTVKPGDTLLKIARQHGVTLKALQAANPKIYPTKLRIGQPLDIPSVDGTKVAPQPTN